MTLDGQQGAWTLDDFLQSPGFRVRARRAIKDVPSAVSPADAERGAVGTIEDIDSCNGVLFVDFGRGAIACTADELVPA